MKVIDKMNQLVGANASKEQIKDWAYMNRVPVCGVHLQDELEELEHTVDSFMETSGYGSDEHENWDKFLDYEVVEVNHANPNQ